jgi:hypothetical protein
VANNDEHLVDYRKLEVEFSEFRTNRVAYDSLINRTREYKLPPDIAGAEKHIDIQTPELEEALWAVASITTMNPTFLDAHVLSTREDLKRLGRDISLWAARTWLQVDLGRWWDRAVVIDQARYGVAISQRLWRQPPESTRPVDLQKHEPFYMERVDPLRCAWEPLVDPDTFYYEYEIPVRSQGDNLMRTVGDGEEAKTLYPVVAAAGRLTWVGERRGIYDAQFNSQEKLHVLVVDRRVPGEACLVEGCNHDRREILEVVFGRNDPEGTIVRQFDSPFKRSSFQVIPGRTVDHYNPQWRFRAMLQPLFAEADTLNLVESIIATRARVDMGDRYWADMTTIPQHLESAWNEMSEGGKKGALDMPDASGRKIPFYPTLRAFPNQVSQHMVDFAGNARERFRNRLPNRFLTGEAFMEARHGAATSYLQAVQSARLPFDLLMGQSDNAIRDNFEEFFHAIKFWAAGTGGEGQPAEPQYPVVLNGEESTQRITASAGEIISMSASLLHRVDFDLQVLTESETLAEQSQRWALAVSKWDRGVLTPEQFLKESGARDVIKQQKELRKADLRAELDPELKQLRLEYIRRVLDVQHDLLIPPPGEPTDNVAGGVIAGPGEQVDQGPPGLEGPRPAPVSPQSITGRFVTPPPVTGPAGGSEPVGNR